MSGLPPPPHFFLSVIINHTGNYTVKRTLQSVGLVITANDLLRNVGEGGERRRRIRTGCFILFLLLLSPRLLLFGDSRHHENKRTVWINTCKLLTMYYVPLLLLLLVPFLSLKVRGCRSDLLAIDGLCKTKNKTQSAN